MVWTTPWCMGWPMCLTIAMSTTRSISLNRWSLDIPSPSTSVRLGSDDDDVTSRIEVAGSGSTGSTIKTIYCSLILSKVDSFWKFFLYSWHYWYLPSVFGQKGLPRTVLKNMSHRSSMGHIFLNRPIFNSHWLGCAVKFSIRSDHFLSKSVTYKSSTVWL